MTEHCDSDLFAASSAVNCDGALGENSGTCTNDGRKHFANETWLKLYGSEYSDLLVIDVEENNHQVEFSGPTRGLLEPLLEVDPEKDSVILIKGLRSLESFLYAEEYPTNNMTIVVFQILSKACTVDIDPILATEAFRVASKLLRFIPPRTSVLRQYWSDVLCASLGCQTDFGKPETQLREKFIELFTNVAQLMKSKDSCKEKLPAFTAHVQIICELLEIDLFCALAMNTKRIQSLLLHSENAPHIATIFWPRGQKLAFVVGRMQLDVLKPIFGILCSTTDAQMRDLCGRLLAMFIEIARLTDENERADVVCFTRTPELLYSLVTDIHFMKVEGALQHLEDTVPFSWLNSTIREVVSSKTALK